MNDRALQLKQWCRDLPIFKEIGLTDTSHFDFSMVSGDASFRRYFRICLNDRQLSDSTNSSYIAVDAPVEHENSEQFIAVAKLFATLDVCCPKVLDQDLTQGFMLLSDLGDRQLLDEIDAENVDQLYGLAFDELIRIQSLTVDQKNTNHAASKPQYNFLPIYDEEKLANEMALFQEWFVTLLLDMSLSESEQLLIKKTQADILARVLKQKQVIVHRDFHSRNLMLCAGVDDKNRKSFERIALIDFQDAVLGPISYDAVSLLKDCYIEWPESQRDKNLQHYYDRLVNENILSKAISYAHFRKDFELMGLQRHLKVLGIFARLSIRDGKHAYLNDLPLTFRYVEQALVNFPEFNEFSEFFTKKLKVKFEALNFQDLNSRGLDLQELDLKELNPPAKGKSK